MVAGGVIRLSPARSKTLVGRILPISHPIAEALARRRARRDPDSPLIFHRDGIPVWCEKTAEASESPRQRGSPSAPTCPPRGRTSSISPRGPAMRQPTDHHKSSLIQFFHDWLTRPRVRVSFGRSSISMS